MRLVPFEIAAVLAIAIAWPYARWSELVPYAFPLVLVAAISNAIRRKAWTFGEGRLVGAVVGGAALVAAIFVGTPIVEALSNRAVEWSQYGFVRGNLMQTILFAIYVAVAAAFAELALRGWIVERVLELSPGPPVLPVLVGAIAEGALTPGSLGVRAGAALFGIGLGWMYVAGGRSVGAPICARVVFAVGALALDGFKIIG